MLNRSKITDQYRSPAGKPRSDKLPEYVLIKGEVKRTTDKAVLISHTSFEGFVTDTWVPRSQIRDGRQADIGMEGLMVSKWFAEKEGIIKPSKRQSA